MTRIILRDPEWKAFLRSSSAKKVGPSHRIHSTPCQSCDEIKSSNVRDENMLPFARRQSASDGCGERHRSAVAGASKKIGDGFFEATATAGTDRTRRKPGTVNSTFLSSVSR